MSILDQYKKSQSSTNLVNDSLKNTGKYTDQIVKTGSPVITQVTSPTQATNLAPAGGADNYTTQIFQQSLA